MLDLRPQTVQVREFRTVEFKEFLKYWIAVKRILTEVATASESPAEEESRLCIQSEMVKVVAISNLFLADHG